MAMENAKGKASIYCSVYKLAEYHKKCQKDEVKIHWRLSSSNDAVFNDSQDVSELSAIKLQCRNDGGKGVLDCFIMRLDCKVAPNVRNWVPGSHHARVKWGSAR